VVIAVCTELKGLRIMMNQIKPNILGTVYDTRCDNAFAAGHGAVYDPQNIAPTLVTATGGQ
jgi:hypothetical protein